MRKGVGTLERGWGWADGVGGGKGESRWIGDEG